LAFAGRLAGKAGLVQPALIYDDYEDCRVTTDSETGNIDERLNYAYRNEVLKMRQQKREAQPPAVNGQDLFPPQGGEIYDDFHNRSAGQRTNLFRLRSR
jgi:hypothetical protein